MILLSSGCFLTAVNSVQITPENQPTGEFREALYPEELGQVVPRREQIAQAAPSSPSTELSTGESWNERPLPAINEACNDDFELEVFPREPAKGNAEFDIPIVVNAKVEQFVQYFQTTVKVNLPTGWLGQRSTFLDEEP
jgi:hypothetical protein